MKAADSSLGSHSLPPAPARRTPWVWVGAGLAVIVAAAILYAFDPAQFRFFPRCAFHQLTGLSCPGCGGQRALHHLLHGDLLRALHYNSLLVVLAPLGGWVLLRGIVRRLFQRELPLLFQHHRWSWLLAGTVICFGIVRNIPLPMFSWLSP